MNPSPQAAFTSGELRPLEQLVVEALDRVATPRERDAILAAATTAHGGASVSHDALVLWDFVQTTLVEQVRLALGEGAADATLTFLQSVLQPLVGNTSGVRPSAANRAARAWKVLVIDDDTLVRASLARFLRGRGFDVSTARGIREALGRVDQSRPDIVLCDLNMPEISGNNVAALLRLRLDGDVPPIILLSGEARLPRGNPDFAAVMSKPVAGEDLVTTISDILDNGRVLSVGGL